MVNSCCCRAPHVVECNGHWQHLVAAEEVAANLLLDAAFAAPEPRAMANTGLPLPTTFDSAILMISSDAFSTSKPISGCAIVRAGSSITHPVSLSLLRYLLRWSPGSRYKRLAGNLARGKTTPSHSSNGTPRWAPAQRCLTLQAPFRRAVPVHRRRRGPKPSLKDSQDWLVATRKTSPQTCMLLLKLASARSRTGLARGRRACARLRAALSILQTSVSCPPL